MKIAAGFIVISKNKVLLGKPYGCLDKWTIFKGCKNDNSESLLDCAKRELKEESGIDLISKFPEIIKKDCDVFFTYKIKDKKKVSVYLIYDKSGVLLKEKLFCSSIIDKDKNNNPEIEKFKWFSLLEKDKIIQSVLPSQKEMMQYLFESLNTNLIDKI